MKRTRAELVLLALLGVCPLQLLAQTPIEGIYTCVDARGRKLTSDRPIPECADRQQKVLNPSGTVRTVVGPTLTAAERAELEAKRRREAEVKARQDEEKRRERALLARYPDRASHDQERGAALAQISVVRKAALQRVAELERQRKELGSELEFYAKDPTKVPPSLKRLVEENTHSMAVQQRFIAEQEEEMQRVNNRFNEELTRLQRLWARAGASAN